VGGDVGGTVSVGSGDGAVVGAVVAGASATGSGALGAQPDRITLMITARVKNIEICRFIFSSMWHGL
jgi:hypothetical protein